MTRDRANTARLPLALNPRLHQIDGLESPPPEHLAARRFCLPPMRFHRPADSPPPHLRPPVPRGPGRPRYALPTLPQQGTRSTRRAAVPALHASRVVAQAWFGRPGFAVTSYSPVNRLPAPAPRLTALRVTPDCRKSAGYAPLQDPAQVRRAAPACADQVGKPTRNPRFRYLVALSPEPAALKGLCPSAVKATRTKPGGLPLAASLRSLQQSGLDFDTPLLAARQGFRTGLNPPRQPKEPP